MRVLVLACGLFAIASPALAQRADLPPEEKVNPFAALAQLKRDNKGS